MDYFVRREGSATTTNISQQHREICPSVWQVWPPPHHQSVSNRDVVFFHGLQFGDEIETMWRSTWLQRDKDVCWPEEWLPQDLDENVRVLLLSYDVRHLDGGGNNDHISEIARNLMQSLVNSDTWKLGKEHPFVLVGHNIGGLVIKALVVEATRITRSNVSTLLHTRMVQNAKSFLQNLKGVVFYAVPQYGGAHFVSYIKKVKRRGVGRNWAGLMKNVELLSRKMGELSMDFDDVMGHTRVVVYAFGEGKEMKDLGYLVEYPSAVVSSRYNNYMVEDADHMDICKPPTKGHPSYSILLQLLKACLKVPELIPKLIPTPNFVSECVVYSYDDLWEATNGFDNASKIGAGIFGTVYQAKLIKEGISHEVAIKKMHYKELNKAFQDEIWRISTVRHKNILALLGYSVLEIDESLLIVTPFHSSLFKSLYNNAQPWLNWQARYKMAMGVAEGLAYLHYGALECLVHGNINAGNILFDPETFEPYIGDFGTSTIMRTTIEKTKKIAGTPGYMDPHFQKYLVRSVKIDVYSFGVLLFVFISGEEAHGLAGKMERKDVVDGKICNEETYRSKEVRRLLRVARQCTKYWPDDRPNMSQVVGMLKGDIPCQPYAQAFAALGIYVGEFLHDIVIDSATSWNWMTTSFAFNCLVGFLAVHFIYTSLNFFFRH